MSKCTVACAALLTLSIAGCDTAGFKDAYMSLDSAGNRQRDGFFTDTEAIYCVGKLVSGVDDITVSAVLRAEQLYDSRTGEPSPVSFYLGTEDQAPGAGEDIIVSFQLERDEADAPYPAGKFVCELALDGRVEERLPFEIAYPTCPEAPIVTGATCRGFVLEGASCPGAFGDDCACTDQGLWQCR